MKYKVIPPVGRKKWRNLRLCRGLTTFLQPLAWNSPHISDRFTVILHFTRGCILPFGSKYHPILHVTLCSLRKPQSLCLWHILLTSVLRLHRCESTPYNVSLPTYQCISLCLKWRYQRLFYF
jgi:hypothetical protein